MDQTMTNASRMLHHRDDHLLCHDDLLEDRRIAFIYYLTSDWSLEDGGSLDLFEAMNGEPGEIKESIVPELNKFVFFEVSPVSFHQVAEVKTENKRLAISGWFHGPAYPSVPHKETLLFTTVSTLPIDITEWINPEYLDPGNQIDIRDGFEENSEVELSNFLQPQKYQEICKTFQDPEITWEQKGPRTSRYCLTLNDATSPAVLRECQALFSSEAFLLVLSNLTGLNLHPACDEETDVSMGKICSSVRKWQNHCYTLLHDDMWKQGESLHAMMYFNCSEWDPLNGGFTSFVSEGEEEPLLLVDPKPNSLALVFITEGTASFVKYVNCNAKKSSFNDIYNVYIESK
ncbi:prolyl 3-hydroxylase OGFOD1-like isoform X2 [Uloborus diversus]|uniref:prolyl 3-hydroxylase OGFOD1-like isoform X2 n=1 Tax=Uloborus diversus TaxID=327109 RepID=UPI002409CFE1|nr:prolyl 3-hydroxylase OGFOD1-like isoform X2 [Uloborus diversus]XP_054706182.1 prolyl 3-hydroxylase OGFOD1-like isoform X2 [Uloborus diversus]